MCVKFRRDTPVMWKARLGQCLTLKSDIDLDGKEIQVVRDTLSKGGTYVCKVPLRYSSDVEGKAGTM